MTTDSLRRGHLDDVTWKQQLGTPTAAAVLGGAGMYEVVVVGNQPWMAAATAAAAARPAAKLAVMHDTAAACHDHLKGSSGPFSAVARHVLLFMQFCSATADSAIEHV